MWLWLAVAWCAVMVWLGGFMAADLWRGRQERPPRTPFRLMAATADPWEGGTEEWRAQGDGAPDYTLPPGTWPGDVVYCPKCVSENRSRLERNEKPLDPVAIIRRRDDAIFCLRHQETFYRSFARWISHLPVLPD